MFYFVGFDPELLLDIRLFFEKINSKGQKSAYKQQLTFDL